MPSIRRAKKHTGFNRLVSSVMVAVMAGVYPSSSVLMANPSGEQLAAGNANFLREGNTLTITQSSQHAIINWQDFSISAGELTKFVQSSANAAVLNRVVTLNPSVIAGALQANGKVILVNPNGITVGPGGVIDVGSFIGSTLDVSNEQFLAAGSLNFVGDSSAGITNLGTITGTDGVFLFAQQIDNAGSIVSGKEVGLATGSNVLLKPVGDDSRVSVLVGTSSDTTLDGDAIRNTGDVQAALVTFKATGSAYSTAVNNAGIIRAQGYDTTGGRVLLTGGTGTLLHSGTISASNSDGTGGAVVLTGERVALTGEAVVDVSGPNGGGTALIGGSYQGKADASVQNAQQTFVGADVQIKADGLVSGKGGTIIVWADQKAIILGTLSAKGASGAQGGFVETSGKQYLVVAKAPQVGPGGTWLIDPNNIEIVAGAGNTNINAADPFDTTDDSAQLGVDLIVAALTGGADVIVTTGTAGGDAEDGNITLTTALDYNGTGTNTLSFVAHNDIIINGVISDSAAGGDNLNLTLIADSDTSGAGGVLLNSAISLSGGTLNLSGSGLALNSTVNANSVLLESTGAITGTGITATNLGVIANGAVSLTTAVSNFAVQKTGTGAFQLTNTGALTIANLGTLDASLATSSITGNASGFITAASPITFAANTVTNTGAGNTFTYTSADNNAANLDNITVNAAVTVSETTGSLVMRSGDSVVINGAVSAGENTTLQAGFGDTDVNGSIQLAGNVTAGADATDFARLISLTNITHTAGTITAANVTLEATTGIGATGAANNITTATGNLEAENTTSGGVFIANTGALSIGTTDAIGGILSTSGDISLTNAGTLSSLATNNFIIETTTAGNVSVTTTGATSDILAGGGVTLIESVGNVTVVSGRDVILGANGSSGDIYSNGNLSVTAARNVVIDETTWVGIDNGAGNLSITAANNLSVQATTLTSAQVYHDGTGNITLTATAGAISIDNNDAPIEAVYTSGGNITIAAGTTFSLDDGAIRTENGGAAGNLSITSVGITLGAAGGLFADEGSGLGGTITLNGGAGAINLAGSITTDNATSAAISITNTGAANNLTLGSISQTNAAGRLTVSSGGQIAQTAATTITSAGTATFATTLNNFGDVVLADSNGNLNFVNNAPLLTNGTVVGGDLTINAGAAGTITDTADADDVNGVGVAGVLTVTGGSTVALDDPNNTVSVIGSGGSGDVVISRAGVIDLGTTVPAAALTGITGNLSVTSKSSGFAFTGVQNGAAITLNQATNNFNNVAFSTDTTGGTFTTTAETGIVQSAPVTFATPATSTTTLLTQASTGNTAGPLGVRGSIILNDAGNNLSEALTFNVQQVVNGNGDVNLVHNGAGNLILGASTLRRALDIQTATANVTQSGVITASGTAGRLTANVGGNLNFSTQTNVFTNNTGVLGDIVVGGDFGFRNTGAIGLASNTSISATGSLVDLSNTTGNISQGAGSFIDAASLVVRAANGSVTLGNALAPLNTVGTVAISSTGAATYVDADGIIVGSVTALDATTTDGITTTDAAIAVTTFGAITLAENLTPGTSNVQLSALGALSTTGGIIVMNGGNLEMSAASIGAIGTPLLTTGSYTLQAQATGGNLIIRNDTAGDVTVNTVAGGLPLIAGLDATAGGAVSFINTAGAITLSRTVDATTNVTISAFSSLAVNAGANIGAFNAQNISLTSGTTMSLAANVGAVGTTTSVTINNTGLLTRPFPGSGTVAATTLILQGTGAIGGAAAYDELTVNTANIDFQKGAALGLVRVQNNSAADINISGAVGRDFAFETNAGSNLIINGDLNLGNLDGNNVADIRSGSGILKANAGDQIIVSGTGGFLSLRSTGAAVGAPDGHINGVASADALEISLVGTLAGNAPGGFYVQNFATGLLTVGSVTSVLGTTTGITGAAGVEINTAGGLTVSNTVSATGNYIQLVGDFNNGPVTINASVSTGAGSGGTLIISGSPIINTAPTIGSADIFISDGNPFTSILNDLTINGNLQLTAAQDIVIGGLLTINGGGTLTLNADSGLADGEGGIVWLSTATNQGEVLLNGGGNLNANYSELVGTYVAGVDTVGGVAISAGTSAGGLSGNSVVFASDSGNPEIRMATGGTATFTPRNGFGNAIIQEGGARSIQGATSTLVFAPDSLVGASGNVGTLANPLRIQVAGLQINRPLDDVFLREQDGINFTAASAVDNLVLEAGTTVAGAIGSSGSVIQNPGATLTANNLTVINRNGSVILGETNSVAQIDLGSATSAFTYFGGIPLLTLAGNVSASTGGTTINVGSNDISQLEDALITGTTITLTFGNMTMRDNIGNASTTAVTINNQFDLTRPTGDTDAIIRASTLNINDQVLGGGNIGTNVVGEDILTNVGILNFNKQVIAPSNIFLRELDAVIIGQTSATTLGDLTLFAGGNITQQGIIQIDGTAVFTASSGNIILNSFPGNAINAFGDVTAVNGRFVYDGSAGLLADNEINFNGLITTTGGEGLGTSTVQITFGGTNDAVFAATGDIVSTGAVTITREALGTGQVRTAGDITTTGDNITFTSADGLLNVRLTGNVVHGTGTGVGGNILYNATVDSLTNSSLTDNAGTGNVTFGFTVGAAGNVLNRLEVNASGTTTFTDDVDAVDVITDFDPAQRGGTTIINGGTDAVVTSGSQIYNDGVLLTDTDAAFTNLDSTNIEFNGTLNTQAADDFVNLTLNAAAGNVLFNGNVGATRALQTLTVNATDITINGVSTVASNFTPAAPDAGGITIRTVGTQNYAATSDIFVGGGTTAPNVLTTHNGAGDTTAGDIVFAANLNGLVDGVTATAAGQNDLVLTAGVETDALATGNINFVNTAGVTTQLGDILITVADDVTMGTAATDVIVATTFIQAFGFGTTTVSGGIRTTSDDTPDFINTFVAAANQPNVVQADALAGGVQISTDQIFIERNITAQNNGIVRLNGLNAGSDVTIIGGTVQATGTISNAVRPAIAITAGDDVFIGSTTQPRDSIVQTTDGAITITAANGTAGGANGILIQGRNAGTNNDALVTAQGANGTVTITATANQGVLTLNGGNGGLANGARAQVSSSQLMTVDADRILLTGGGAGNNSFASLTSANGQVITARNTVGDANAIVLQGGAGGIAVLNARAQIENSAGTQSVTADVGDIVLSGGTSNTSDARIRATGTSTDQTITVTDGDLRLTGGSAALLAGDALIELSGGAAGAQTIAVSGAAEGTITVLGGSGALGNASITTDRLQLITAENGILVQGGTGVAASTATISATGATGRQSILVENGDLSIQGGSTALSTATVTSAGVNGAGADEEAQRIIVENGNLIASANAAVGIPNSALISATNAGTATQLIDVSGSITVSGGTAAIAGAAITSAGFNATQGLAQSITAGTGLSLTAGSGAAASANITASGVQGRQEITVTTGDLTLTGGGGAASSATITAAGLNGAADQQAQRIRVLDGNLVVQAGTNTAANATITATNTAAATQFIDVNGSISVLGGSGTNAAAALNSAGYSTIIAAQNLAQTIRAQSGLTVQGGTADGTNATIAANGAESAQRIVVTTGDLQILGGIGSNADASITAAGINDDDAQTIIVEDGNLLLDAGNADNNDSSATILATNTGAATQNITVSGTITLLGGAGTNEIASIRADGFNAVQGLAQNISAGNGLVITAGLGEQSDAGIRATGLFGHQLIDVTGNATITGGDGLDSNAFIIADGINGTAPEQFAQSITVTDGNLVLQGNLEATNTGGTASIEATNTGEATQVITVINNTAGGTLSVLGGTGTGDTAFINAAGYVADNGTGNARAQNISVDEGLTVQGGTGLNTTAQINATGLFGRQFITVNNGDLSVLGGSGTDANARIQAGGADGAGEFAQRISVASGNLFVTANAADASGDAAITSSQAGQTQSIDVGGLDGGFAVVRGGGANTTAGIVSNGAQTLTIAGALLADPTTVGLLGDTSEYIYTGTLGLGVVAGTGINSSALVSALGTQQVTVTTGDTQILGGGATAADTAAVAGILLTGNADQTVLVQLGNTLVRGGAGANSSAGIQLVGDGLQTLTIANVANTVGTLTVLGGAGDFAFAGIQNTGTGNQLVDVAGNTTLRGGAGEDSNAAIHQSGTGDQRVRLLGVGNLLVEGGIGEDADAYILADAATGPIGQTVSVADGNLTVLANQDAGANNSDAYIQSFDAATTQTISVQGSGNITLTAGTGDNERAQILSGNIQDIDANGTLVVTGGNGAGTGSYSEIRAVNTQTIDIVNAGNAAAAISLQGGSSTGADDYALIVGATNGTATQTITTTRGDIVISGNAGNSSAALDSSSTEFGAAIIANGLAQTITLNGAGDLALTGGIIDDSAAAIELTNNAATAVQTITVGVDAGDLSLNGGTGLDAYALIRSAGTGVAGVDIAQVITVQDSITLNGNAASSTALFGGEEIGAGIVSDGSQTIATVTDGNIALNGGTVTDSKALVLSTALTGTQLVTVGGAGNLALLGGSGEDADAIIRGAGLVQTLTVTAGNLSITANQDGASDDADALIEATNAATTQTISVQGSGNITVTAGTGSDETARIGSANIQDIDANGVLTVTGGNGVGTGSFAEIGAVNTQTIDIVNAGNAAAAISLQGGSSTGADDYALIVGATNGTATQTITTTRGDIVISGNQGNSSAALDSSSTEFGAAIIANGLAQTININGTGDLALTGGTIDDSAAAIELTNNAATAVQTITVGVDAGDLSLNGGTGLDAYALIRSAGTGVAGVDIAQVITVQDNITFNGNAASSSVAFGGEEIGAGIVTDGSQTIATVTDGNIVLNGGTITDSKALVLSTALTGTQLVTVGGAGNLALLGGSGEDADAIIRGAGLVQTLTVTAGNLSVTANQDGASDDADALIEATNAATTQTISVQGSGNITVTAGTGSDETARIGSANIQDIDANGTLVVTGGNGAGTGSFADIRAVNTQTIDIVNAADAAIAISLQGGTSTGAGDYAAIIGGTNQTAAQTITTTRGDIVLAGNEGNSLFGLDFSTTRFGAGIIANGFAQTITLNGAGDLSLTGGSIDDSAALIDHTNMFATAVQRITVGVDAGDLTLQGGTGTDAYALIRSRGMGVTGVNIAQVISVQDNITLNGGAATSTVAFEGEPVGAGIVTAGSQTLRTETPGSIGINGGTATNSKALVLSAATNGTQLVTVGGAGNLALLGGNGVDADAIILGLGQVQTITVTNGNLTVTANQDSTNANSDARIHATDTASTQTISVSGALAGQITVQGGAGADETAEILANGVQDITAANGITVAGGLGTNSTAAINKLGDPNDTQTITVTAGDFTITGGDGQNADASVISLGVTQTITVSNGSLSVTANQNADNANSDALISLLTNFVGPAVQTINVTNGGITVSGGAGTTETAAITMLDLDGQQAISAITDGDITLTGGGGLNSTARITSAGLDAGVGSEAQRIIIDAGRLQVLANTDATNAGGFAQIAQTNAGAASQFITVSGTTGTDGTLTITGGAANDEDATIESAGTINQTLLIASGVAITGGTGGVFGNNSSAGIIATGVNVTQSVSVNNGDLTLTGGTGGDADAFITQSDSAGLQNIAVSGASATSSLLLTGGNGLDSAARILAFGTLQSIVVANGNLSLTANQDAANANGDAQIQALSNDATQSISVSGVGSGLITLLGGAGTEEVARIHTNGIQFIDAANGISVTGGTGTDSAALIQKIGDAADLQFITVGAGDFSIVGGDGENADASVISNGIGQTILVNNGNLIVTANQDGAADSASALISATNAAVSQFINVQGSGNITLAAGTGSDEFARIVSANTQGITANGVISLTGGNGTGAGSFADINATDVQIIQINNATDAATALSILGGSSTGANDYAAIVGNAQQGITVTQGSVVISGNAGNSSATIGAHQFGAGIVSTGAGTQTLTVSDGDLTLTAGTAAGSAAVIDQNVADAQLINVTGALALTGGSANDAFATITASGTQTIGVSANAILTGGSAGDVVYASIEAANTQQITVGTGLQILGGSSAGTDDAAAIIGEADQTVTVTTGDLVLAGNQGGVAAAPGTAVFGAGIVSTVAGTQTITVSDGSLSLTGGTTAGSGALIDQNVVAAQTIDVSGALTLGGGTGTDAFAFINALGTQDLTVGGDAALTGGSGSNANAFIFADDTQTIEIDGNLSLAANTDAINANGFAEIFADADQSITVNGLVGLSLTGGTGADDYAYIGANGDQLIAVTAGNLLLTGGDTFQPGGDTDATIESEGGAFTTQTINVAGTVTLNGTVGTLASVNGSANILTNGDIQTLTAGGNIALNGGTGANARALIQQTNGAGDQIITSTNGSISLNDGIGADAVIGSANTQTINAVNGTVNLAGDNGFQSLVTSNTTTVINTRGGTWAGAGNVTAGTSITLNTTAQALIIDESSGFAGLVSAPTLIIQGDNAAATIGASTTNLANTRLNTAVNAVQFDGVGSKSVSLHEADTITLEGTVGTLNVATIAAGDITDAANFTATLATLQTAAGNIDLDNGNVVTVATFAGLVANGGSVLFNGTGDTTFADRALSSEVVAGAGLFASNDIIIDTTGATNITAANVRSDVLGDLDVTAASVFIGSDLVEVVSGDIIFNSADITLDAANASTGGRDGPTGAVGVIRTLNGTQSYLGDLVLLTNTRITADGTPDTVLFDGTINGPGGLQIGSSPVFNDFIGDVTPLAYLILDSDSTFNATSGDPTFGPATVNLTGSFINNGILTLGDAVAADGINQNFTFIVDTNNPNLGGSIFQGGVLANHISQDAANGNVITVFGAAFGSITFDNIPLGNSFYQSYTFDPAFAFEGVNTFTPGFIYFKGPGLTPENLRERLEREAAEKDTTVAYDGSVVPVGIAALAGTESTAFGTAGGVAVSTFDLVTPGESEVVTQTVFGNIIILP